MVLILYICYALAKKTSIIQFLIRQRCIQAASPTYQAEADVETESDTESLPHRLINPEEYEPVLPIREHSTAEPTEDKELVPRRLTPVYTYEPVLATTEETQLLSPQKTWASI